MKNTSSSCSEHQRSDDDSSLVLTRRSALAAFGAAGVALTAPAFAKGKDRAVNDWISGAWDDAKGEYTLPALPYGYGALEPFIDERTMRIHHDKHHAGYVRGANKALAELKKIRAGTGDAALMKHWSRQLAFAASGHINHTFFWNVMAPAGSGGGGEPTGAMARAINRDFGSFSQFSEHFQAASRSVEGSGWGWLVLDSISNRLLVIQAEKHQNETVRGSIPLLGVDVWEHAYYLNYQNRRGDYVKAFMSIINWSAVSSLYDDATE